MSNDIKIITYGNSVKGANDSVKQGNLELVMKVTAAAKTLAPWDTGILRNSIMWKVPGESGGHTEGNTVQAEPEEGNGLVGTATEYAAYVEFGTRRQAAQPYLRPAVQSELLGSNGANTMKEACIKAMKEALNKGKKVFNG